MKNIVRDKLYREFADAPASLSYLQAHFSPEEPERCGAFLDDVDASPFSLRDWVAALLVLARWLDAHDAYLPLKDQLGYVRCATEAGGAGANLLDLAALVEEMLATYGCERALKK